jgi:hypothetical protein
MMGTMEYPADRDECLRQLSMEVERLHKEKALLESKIFAGLDKDASFDVGRLMKELWQWSDTGDYGSITLGELVSLYPRCRA